MTVSGGVSSFYVGRLDGIGLINLNLDLNCDLVLGINPDLIPDLNQRVGGVVRVVGSISRSVEISSS